ncbi:MAG: phosphoribosylanthranilate isomerase [candidate division NC10 bacterium]|nr:phosphoribosylanthranilate isomerase [candidate division NC10 bacterium]
MTKVKICGLTTPEDALFVAGAGADVLGFVFVPGTPRYIDPASAAIIIKGLPLFVHTVGVFADAPLGDVKETAELCRLDFVQLHGEESPEYCAQAGMKVIKAIRVRGPESLKGLARYRVEAFLLDTHAGDRLGGTGKTFAWDLALAAKGEGRIILSGGLNPENVATAIRQIRPYGVDVSSGVEASPGRKDPEKVRRFLEQVRHADQG